MSESVFEYGEHYQITLPADMCGCFIYARAAPGDNHHIRRFRDVSSEGQARITAVRQDYHRLIKFLTPAFGQCYYASGHELRANSTTEGLMASASRVHALNMLDHMLSLKKIDDGEFKRAHEAKGFAWMVQAVALNHELLESQPLEGVVRWTRDLVKVVALHHGLTLATGFELNASMFAQDCGFPIDHLGLNYCQAYVLFLNKDFKVANIQKFTPPATIGF
jgi:hypothetical protein